MPSSLNEKTAVVTGCSRGIGRAIALELAKRGAKVAVNYVYSENAAQEVAAEIQDQGGEAAVFQADVANLEQATQLIKQSIDRFGSSGRPSG